VCLAQIPHWLAEVRSFCSHHMQRPLTVAVLDIGANMGYHTVKPGSKIANGGRLHAFEPNPEVHAVCLENSKINGLLGMFRSVTSRSVTCPERPCRAARTATCSPPT
jgi:predicted RNA methylase